MLVFGAGCQAPVRAIAVGWPTVGQEPGEIGRDRGGHQVDMAREGSREASLFQDISW